MLGGGGRSGTQKFVYQKWADQIFPTVKFVASHDEGGIVSWEIFAFREGDEIFPWRNRGALTAVCP